jgi:undecaprenyl-diphosphatase
MIIFAFFYKSRRDGIIIVIFALLLFATTDLLSYRVLKPLFGRLRPCNPKYFVDGVHQFLLNGHFLMGYKGSYSLPSNHSLNMFAQATYWTFLFPKFRYYLFGVAITVGFSRVYVGVHYPFDILLGAIIGIGLGYIFYWFIKKLLKKNVEPTEVVE